MMNTERQYQNALNDARRAIAEVCYGRPCLEKCLERLGETPPLCTCAGGWGLPKLFRWLLWALAAFAFVFLCFRVRAGVQCVWDDNSGSYICSGDGSFVTVIGGGNGDVVVTNIVGVCTNCVAMSPAYVRDWKSSAIDIIDLLNYELYQAKLLARDVTGSLDVFAHDPDGLSYYIGSLTAITAMSNFWISSISPHSDTIVYQSAVAGFRYLNNGNLAFPPTTTANWARFMASWNGALDYANQVSPDVSTALDKVNEIDGIVSLSLDDRLPALSSMIGDLSEQECTNQWDGANNGGGSGATTNILSGNWCTYDQGEAIIGLLGDLKKWSVQALAQLSAISNYTLQVKTVLQKGLFSSYSNIPRNQDWQTVYFDGQSTNWGYEPTNILQRIELILYGMSGLSTNSLDRSTIEDTDSNATDWKQDVLDLETDAEDQRTSVQSIGDALVNFFGAFTPERYSGNGGDVLIPEVQVSVGSGPSLTIPAVRIGQTGVISQVSGYSRLAFTVLYFIVGALSVWAFWVWFAGHAIRMIRWAVDLLTAMFSS